MMDLYWVLFDFTIGLVWLTAIVFLALCWYVWADAEIREGALHTSNGTVVDLSDMLFLTVIIVLGGFLGGWVAGLFCPISLPIIAIIGTVYTTKICHEWKQHKAEKELKAENASKLKSARDTIKDML